jgi:hypothetical protein
MRTEAGTAAYRRVVRHGLPEDQDQLCPGQTGALYNKISTERAAAVSTVDILQLSDLDPALDFQKMGGFENLTTSPEAGPATKARTHQPIRPAPSSGPASPSAASHYSDRQG